MRRCYWTARRQFEAGNCGHEHRTRDTAARCRKRAGWLTFLDHWGGYSCRCAD